MANTSFSEEEHLPSEFPWVLIEKLRQMKGISKKDIASKLQLNYSYLVDLLNGRYPSKIDNQKIQTLSEILNIPINELLSYLTNKNIPDLADKPDTNDVKIKLPQEPLSSPSDSRDIIIGYPARKIPLIEHNSEERIPDFARFINSTKGEINQKISEYYNPAYLNNSDILAIKLQDDSMFPPFSPRTIFMFHKKSPPKLNEIVFIVIGDNRAWVREWHATEGSDLIFKPYNPKYDYLQINSKDIIASYPMISMETRYKHT